MRDSDPKTQTKQAILDATDKLLAKYGYKKMTIEDLALAVGIGKGSVYLHFSSKEEIALSHIDRIIDRLKSNLREIAARPGRAESRLKDMLIERVMYRFDSVQHYSQSVNELLSAVRPKLLARRKGYFAEEAQIFAAVIAEGQQAGTIRKGDPRDLAVTFLSATNALLPYSLSVVELGDRGDVLDRTTKTADVLIRGTSRK
ncbi:MAG: TetR/AcrR family transcriptional regulator [Chloracidobacterium sp.]|nr:TetR/AcrR family transcriptional regulator [Chloracidobacterium sp.]